MDPSPVRNLIDRVGPGDLMTLAADHGAVPMNIAAILLLDRGSDLDVGTFRTALSSRIGAVPRLRQRLVGTPLGCGRPVWLDDADFDLARHLSTVELSSSGTQMSLLQIAASAACARLDPRRPLWAAHLVTGVEGGRAALVIVMHHVLADGIGGLAVLGALSDTPAQPEPASHGTGASVTGSKDTGSNGTVAFPTRPPSRTALAREALGSRTAGLAHLPRAVRGGVGGIRELGHGVGRPTLAPATSLNIPTGGHRRLTTLRVRRAEIVKAAHREHCTVNDLLVAAVTGALDSVLKRRGEHPSELVLSIPVATRRAATAADLGNHTGVLPLRIPTMTSRSDRLRHIAAVTRTWRSNPRGQSAGPLAAGFRLLAALRLFQPFVDHQRFVNTFVTNVRGPREPVDIAGHRILEVIPVAVVPGNVGVAFQALSYADQLVITVTADPVVTPDQAFLTDSLATELSLLVRPEVRTSQAR